MSHFQHLKTEWPRLYEAATKAEQCAYTDPRTACFYSRRALETAINWLFECDDRLTLPYKTDLSGLLFEPSFKRLLGEALHTKCDLIRRLGNNAVHSNKPVTTQDAIATLQELFHICYWLGLRYGLRPTDKPDPQLKFQPDTLPKTSPIPTQTIAQIQTLADQLSTKDNALSQANATNAELQAEIATLRAEIAEAQKVQVPDPHDYNEAETRDRFIDLLLKEAGWAIDAPNNREFLITGMPNQSGTGFIDYVLWGQDGKPLALIEAKRTRRSPLEGQQQAKLYADCLEQQFSQRPIIFYTNGYEHHIWDDTNYPPRPIQGFLKQDELALIIQRRNTRIALGSADINDTIAGRYYQTRAIRKIGEAFQKDKDRQALLVMATGSGKTRTVIALCDLLQRCNWVKRVLFLADRVALVNQATQEFNKHLPNSSPVNLITEKDTEGRIYLSTYPTMMGLIDQANSDKTNPSRKFGVGHFDLIIIDEAHRSVYQKYRAIFDYFDCLLVGLTATPKDEIDRNTYSLFNLETGVPTDVYSLEEAVPDGFLVPPQAVSVPLKFQREGIKYDELSEAEQADWDELDWDEDGNAPDRVEASALNQWLFNIDTVDKALAHLMTRGQTVAGGDRLGKTIIFAKNNDHAEFIYERFNANYPHYKGEFARIITHKTPYAQTLINDFSKPEKLPHIAISVDMLDTGIDIPEVVNLVFFKLVRSRTKFWQMLGRGTRLCPNLFGPDQSKEFFYIFDYCQNLEYFSQNPATTEGAIADSLSKRLFTARLELLQALDHKTTTIAAESAGTYGSSNFTTESQVRTAIAHQLHAEVSAMNLDNFIVRPQRQSIEHYTNPTAWQALQSEQIQELTTNIAGLPTGLPSEPEEAKRFDLLMLRLQLEKLRSEDSFTRLRQQLQTILNTLEEKDSIPIVREQMSLIQEMQTDSWWVDVTIPMLENARKRLRNLIRLIEKNHRQPIYTNFIDELGSETEIAIQAFGQSDEFDRFRAKARQFLLAHEDHITIHKLRFNQALTATDLSELERILLEAGIAKDADLAQAKQISQGLGIFIRSLIGLDREAAKQAFGVFLAESTATANQIEFINLIIDHLTHHGIMDPGSLYESPFTDINSQGPEGVFSPKQVDSLVTVLEQIRAAATEILAA
jgi:type I restriction enzyme, R subunit